MLAITVISQKSERMIAQCVDFHSFQSVCQGIINIIFVDSCQEEEERKMSKDEQHTSLHKLYKKAVHLRWKNHH